MRKFDFNILISQKNMSKIKQNENLENPQNFKNSHSKKNIIWQQQSPGKNHTSYFEGGTHPCINHSVRYVVCLYEHNETIMIIVSATGF